MGHTKVIYVIGHTILQKSQYEFNPSSSTKLVDLSSMAKNVNRLTQQTQNICITFIQCWTNVEDVGPTLHKCYTYALCLLGS